MNYSDFEKIEQDGWSLTRPTFPTPKGGTLTVVGWCGKKGATKYYVVECNLCKKDKELNGDGVYGMLKGDLRKGSIPCRCSKSTRYTKDQWKVRVRRSAEGKGLKFISFVGEFKGGGTKLKLFCPNHGSWESTSIASLVNSGNGCPSCSRTVITAASTKEDDHHVTQFMAAGGFQKGARFWRSERKNSRGHRVYWFYKCPVCSEDEYAKVGLCSGVFEADCGNLKRGLLPCRCSKHPYLTEDQWTYRMGKEAKEKGHTFVKWVEESGTMEKFQYLCPLHGEQVTTATNYLQGKGCPSCAGHLQRQCYINQVIDGGLVVALKFGISKESSRRLVRQNATNLFTMEQIGVWEFPSVKACKAAEKQCKKELECGILMKRELPDGHTETTHIKNLDRIIEIYENHGGKRINTNEER